MIFLTVNDLPSGVYESQVIDVVRYLNSLNEEKVKLVSFVSVKAYRSVRKQLKSLDPTIQVYPMFPGLKNWRKTKFLLRFVSGITKERIIARGPMSAYLALQLNKEVVYDGRGAVKAELIEFPGIIPDKSIVDGIVQAEQFAVLNSFKRISVSQALVNYWSSEFSYKKTDHVVIPCTISTQSASKQKVSRKDLGFGPSDKVLVFSGGVGDWQSLGNLIPRIEKWIEEQQIKVIFLAKQTPQLDSLKSKFPHNVVVNWVDKNAVHDYLALADYGLLIRDNCVTNEVASPVKFAEYLNAGLKVIISPKIGDFSSFVEKHQAGFVLTQQDKVQFVPTKQEERARLKQLANDYFTKSQYENLYRQLFQ